MTEDAFGDPLSQPFWDAARRHELVVQRCGACGTHVFYPRPFCTACDSDDLAWVPATGEGTIHSMTTVHVRVVPDLEPPYVVALVELDEGPRLLTNIRDEGCAIGERVRVTWGERAGQPPLPLFERC